MARAVGWPAIASLIIASLVVVRPSAGQEPECVNIFHDEVYEKARQRGPMNAIMLANLLGHWPQYELRVRPIQDYQSADIEACKATLYLGTLDEAEIPESFLADFSTSRKRLAWIGFGVQKLNPRWLEQAFHHQVSGRVTIDDNRAKKAGFYQYVSYKGSVFHKDVQTSNGTHEGAFDAVRFVPVGPDAAKVVLAHLIHNETNHSIPYFLRADNRFLVGDIPFAYMHEADRYLAFADLLFDILDEQPVRQSRLAFARTEDIHGFYDREILRASFATMRAEGVPISIAHIPLFMDPFNAYHRGYIRRPAPANLVPGFTAMIADLVKDNKNAILWHGTTHQFALTKNPHSGTSGDDYEFWNAVAQRPVDGDGVAFTLDRLAQGLRVFEHYRVAPRYWVTPHYQASATNNRVFGAVFPWTVGGVTYYASSFKPAFTVRATNPQASILMPSVTRQLLSDLKNQAWGEIDARSEEGQSQTFPFEIYRDVYGQRIIPETLGYLSFEISDQTDFIRTPEQMLADAQRNLVVRDYWASFFFHPFIFASREEGGVGSRRGDTSELRKLLIGLKSLGYQFVGLGEFEASLRQQPKNHARQGG
jgi:uncharacterized protein YdaL